MKPERVRGLQDFGDDFEAWDQAYDFKEGEDNKELLERFKEFVRLVNEAPDQEFAKQIDSFMDWTSHCLSAKAFSMGQTIVAELSKRCT